MSFSVCFIIIIKICDKPIAIIFLCDILKYTKYLLRNTTVFLNSLRTSQILFVNCSQTLNFVLCLLKIKQTSNFSLFTTKIRV